VKRGTLTHDEEVAEKMRINKYNIRVTNISYTKNVINRGRVFITLSFQVVEQRQNEIGNLEDNHFIFLDL